MISRLLNKPVGGSGTFISSDFTTLIY